MECITSIIKATEQWIQFFQLQFIIFIIFDLRNNVGWSVCTQGSYQTLTNIDNTNLSEANDCDSHISHMLCMIPKILWFIFTLFPAG